VRLAEALRHELGEGRAHERRVAPPEGLLRRRVRVLDPPFLVDDEDAFAAEIFAGHGISYDADLARRVKAIRRPLARVPDNVALMIHEDGATEDEALAYLKRWALMSDRRAKQAMKFIVDPMWRPYVTTYEDGYDVCKRWVAGDRARFRRLLTEQLTPADLT
jgi:hypothetical protein